MGRTLNVHVQNTDHTVAVPSQRHTTHQQRRARQLCTPGGDSSPRSHTHTRSRLQQVSSALRLEWVQYDAELRLAGYSYSCSHTRGSLFLIGPLDRPTSHATTPTQYCVGVKINACAYLRMRNNMYTKLCSKAWLKKNGRVFPWYPWR